MHPPAARPYILLIEDDAAIGDMVTLLLSEEYRVRWCRSAATALAVLAPPAPVDPPLPPGPEAGPPDLILLDLALGSVSGVTLMQQVAARCSSVPPVVLVSAGDELALMAAAATIGAVTTLRKPFEPMALLTLLAAVAGAAPGHHRRPDADAPPDQQR